MSTPKKSPSKTYRPSLYVPGLYSMQAIARDETNPDITIHREHFSALLVWKQEMVVTRRFSHFAMRHATDRSDFYDRLGRGIADPDLMPRPAPQQMTAQSMPASRSELADQAPWLVISPAYCAGFESHAGCSAADRANYYTMTDLLLNCAGDDRDREHIYVLGSNATVCETSVIIMDLTQVTDRTQGVFFERYKRVSAGWPIHSPHYRSELARTFASCRYDQLIKWLADVRMLTRPGENRERFEFVLASLPPPLRFKLASAFVSHVFNEFTLAPGQPEGLTEHAIPEKAWAIGPQLDALLSVRTPMSNS